MSTDSPHRLSEKHIVELDGVRGVAVIFVVVWHYVAIPLGLHLDPTRWQLNGWPLLILLKSGVDLFFVLSGFLIGGILLDRRFAQSYFKPYWIRRACRILPLYLILLISFVVAKFFRADGPLFDGPIPLIGYVTFTQNYFAAHYLNYGAIWLSATWSLAVEEQFYLIFPFCTRFFYRYLHYIIIVAVTGAPLMRIWSFRHFGNDYAAYMWLLCRSDSLAWGVALAMLIRRKDIVPKLRSCRRLAVRALLILLAPMVVLPFALARNIGYHMSFWGHSLLAIFYTFSMLVVFLYTGDRRLALLRSSVLTGAGKFSYGIYLVHAIFLTTTFSVFGRHAVINSSIDVALLLLALVLTVSTCAFSFFLIERPILAMGKRFDWR